MNRSRIQKTLHKFDKRYMFIGFFLVVGVIALAITRAGGPFASLQPESANRSGTAIGSDAAASGGQYMQFGSGPVSPPPQTGQCGGNPNGTTPRAAFPCDATTGPTTSSLASRAGFTITQDGAVISNLNISGSVVVEANNVTIRNVIITSSGNVLVNNGQNLVVEDSILRGTGNNCGYNIGPGNYTLRRSELSGCFDGGKLSGRVEVYDSYIHDTYRIAGETHNDTFQKNPDSSLSSLVLKGNALYGASCTSNRHLQLNGTKQNGQPYGQVTIGSVFVENNFFYGIKGLLAEENVTITAGAIRNNTFAGTPTRGPFSVNLYSGNVPSRTGNVYENGASANGNYVTSTYQCVGG